jgi:hypothetical protein
MDAGCRDWHETETDDAEDAGYFGWCPACGGSNGVLNIGYAHWFHCHRHRTKWYVGSNLFERWKCETKAIWDRNIQHLADYREVEAHIPTAARLERLYAHSMKGGA